MSDNTRHMAAALKMAKRAGDKAFIEAYQPPSVELPEMFSVYANAYLLLDDERREYTAPIPWSACVLYAQTYRFNVEQMDWLIQIVREVDRLIIPIRVKEAKRGENPSRSGKAAR